MLIYCLIKLILFLSIKENQYILSPNFISLLIMWKVILLLDNKYLLPNSRTLSENRCIKLSTSSIKVIISVGSNKGIIEMQTSNNGYINIVEQNTFSKK